MEAYTQQWKQAANNYQWLATSRNYLDRQETFINVKIHQLKAIRVEPTS